MHRFVWFWITKPARGEREREEEEAEAGGGGGGKIILTTWLPAKSD